VEIELMQMLKSCEENGAHLTAVFQAGHCNEEQTLVLCKMTKRTGITLASTGDEFRAEQVELMLRKLAPYAEVKIAGDGLSLEEVLKYQQAGVVRFGLRQPLALLTAWKQQLEAEAGEEVPPAPVIS
jgi:deoxyribose-phosphate aldolase